MGERIWCTMVILYAKGQSAENECNPKVIIQSTACHLLSTVRYNWVQLKKNSQTKLFLSKYFSGMSSQ